MGISIENNGTWHQIGDINDNSITNSMSNKDMEKLIACVKESGVSKDDIELLIQVLKDINNSQNDLTTEFAKMADEQKVAQKTGTLKKIQDRVTLTNGMITLGKTAIGIATKNPVLALESVKDLAK